MTKKKTKWHIVLRNSLGTAGTVKHAYVNNRRQRDKVIAQFKRNPVIFKDAVPSIVVTRIVTTKSLYVMTSYGAKRKTFKENRHIAPRRSATKELLY